MAERSGPSPETGDQGVVLALAVVGSILLLFIVVWLLPSGAHDGRAAGNLAMAVPAVAGLGGLGLAWLGRRPGWVTVRAGATVALILGLAYLTLGALEGNARWALPVWRAVGYVGSIGATWLAEWLLRNHDDGLQGVAGRAAVMAGFAVVAFELAQILNPLFDLPSGTAWSLELYRSQESTRAFLLAGCWALYSTGVMAVGVWLGAAATRILAAGLLFLTNCYVLAFGVFNLAADVWLRAAGMAAVVLGTAFACYLGERTQGARRPRERLVCQLLVFWALLVAVLWVGREVFAH